MCKCIVNKPLFSVDVAQGSSLQEGDKSSWRPERARASRRACAGYRATAVCMGRMAVDKCVPNARAREGIKNVRFELGNIDNLKCESEAFDLSFCRLVLIHVSSPVKTIAELRRVTKKGGIVAASDVDDGAMLSFPQAPRFFDLWSKFGQWAGSQGGRPLHRQTAFLDIFRGWLEFMRSRARFLLREQGHCIVSCRLLMNSCACFMPFCQKASFVMSKPSSLLNSSGDLLEPAARSAFILGTKALPSSL